MRISIYCVGRLKEKYWTEALKEYTKRLSRYVSLDIFEIGEEKAPENMSDSGADIVRKKEGERILKALKEDSFKIALAIEGKSLSSMEFATLIEKTAIDGIGHIAFIIGGPIGLSTEVINECDLGLSFSKFTFPHQMMRIILLEQIYRGFRIIKNEPYHR